MYRDIDSVHYKISFHACPGAASKQMIDCDRIHCKSCYWSLKNTRAESVFVITCCPTVGNLQLSNTVQIEPLSNTLEANSTFLQAMLQKTTLLNVPIEPIEKMAPVKLDRSRCFRFDKNKKKCHPHTSKTRYWRSTLDLKTAAWSLTGQASRAQMNVPVLTWNRIFFVLPQRERLALKVDLTWYLWSTLVLGHAVFSSDKEHRGKNMHAIATPGGEGGKPTPGKHQCLA